MPTRIKPLLLFAACSAAAASAASCHDRCVGAGHCCVGLMSACANPSCDMGCMIGSVAPDQATCNATCLAGSGKCSLAYKNFSFGMCGGCAQKWLDPTTLQPEIIPGSPPYWPPGYQISGCSSCDDVHDECMLGCVLAFNPSVAPPPPAEPPAPPDVPMPPAPWPNAPGSGFNFSVVFSDHIVLQQAPALAAVYGVTGTSGAGASVSVTVTPSGGGQPYTVPAAVADGRWKALLQPTPDSARAVTFSIAATCASGCTGNASTVVLNDVVFGDVWYAAGQSNMVKNFLVTYGGADSLAAINAGKYDNVRLMSGTSEVQGITPHLPPTHPWRTARAAGAIDPSDPDSWWQFSAAAWHFAEALTDQHVKAGKAPPTLGLVSTAIGGSQIEEWITTNVASQCFGFEHNANGGFLNHITWDNCVTPFLDMSIKGAIYYQGENNAGTLHGNSAQRVGYSCMMPRLVELWRREWSRTPNTTDPLFPFGLVSLSTSDSESAADIGSFRFAQVASYGTLPNPAMPNTWVAHAYDLADPWIFCEDNPPTKTCPGCDTVDARYNCSAPSEGPEIHPRLKVPVGQRLAVGALVSAYGFPGPAAGPTISGCTYTAGAGASLLVNFSVPAGAAMLVVDNGGGAAFSGFSALVGATDVPDSGTWVALNISQVGGASAIAVDVSPLNGQAIDAIKYAWGPTGGRPNGDDVQCCVPTASKECLPAMCPIFAAQPLAPYAGLPANPFMAQVTAEGKCECPAPQMCDA